jgi:ankyrin repeat protein
LGDNAEVIRELAIQGADLNARTRDEVQTPLHIAAAMGKMKAVEALVALGADVAIKDSQGRTALDAAERAGLTDVVAFLRRSLAAK